MNVLIIGGSGMLGSQCVDFFSSIDGINTYCTCRNKNKYLEILEAKSNLKVFSHINVLDINSVEKVVDQTSPDIVINCAGAIKQKDIGINPVDAISINGLFPHQLVNFANKFNFKLILVSTDCVFNGENGQYTEDDYSDCLDIYGKSKFIGEVHNQSNVLTIRTSIIGIEVDSSLSLLSWFLKQKDPIKGFNKAIYSGVPTSYLAQFIYNHYNLSGLYHLSSLPISKYDLLRLFAEYYDHDIQIIKDNNFKIDRSLKSKKLIEEIDFIQPSWTDLITFLPK